MLAFTFKRLLALIPVLFGVAVVTFLLILLIPGDPADALLPPGTPAEARRQFVADLNLDGNVVARFGAWLAAAVQGDLGQSIQRREPASDVMATALGNTLELVAVALVIAVVGGVVFGVAIGWWTEARGGRALNSLVVSLASVPQFWLGLILLYVFAVQLGWLPTSGKGPATGEASFTTSLRYMILPAVTVSLLPLAMIARLTRTLVLELRRQEFVTTLRTRGYSTPRVMRHVLRNAAPGVVNIIGLQAGYLVLGTLFAEVVFAWPGIGTAIFDAINSRDYPVIQAIVLATGAVFACITVLVDVAIRLLDPRTEAHT